MRYGVFALMLVVGFMTGFLIPVVSDVFVNGWPVTHRYQVGDPLAEMARAVAQLTQRPTPPPKISQPSTPDRASVNNDAFRTLVRCLESSANSPYLQRWWERLDGGSRAHAKMIISSCGSEVDAYFAVPSEKVAKILGEGVYGIAIQFLEMNPDEQIRPIPWSRYDCGWDWMNCKELFPTPLYRQTPPRNPWDRDDPFCRRLLAAGLRCLSTKLGGYGSIRSKSTDLCRQPVPLDHTVNSNCLSVQRVA